MNKDTFWFKHDSNASQDPKMVMLTSVYGFEGYGRFWRIIEMIREQEGYRIDISSKHAFKMFASLLMFTNEEEAKNFIQDCVEEFNLLEMDNEHLWSPSLIRRMETWDKKKEQTKKAAAARWNKKKSAKKKPSVDAKEEELLTTEHAEKSNKDADAMRTHSERNTIREEKRREEEIREDNNSISLSLNAQAREENFEEMSQIEDAEELPHKKPNPPPEEKVLWLQVAEEMTQYLTEEQAGKDQWEMMCYAAGGHVEPKIIAFTWAGWNQESTYILENWKTKHVGKLTGWIKRHLQDERKKAKVTQLKPQERGKVSDYSKPRPKVRSFG